MRNYTSCYFFNAIKESFLKNISKKNCFTEKRFVFLCVFVKKII